MKIKQQDTITHSGDALQTVTTKINQNKLAKLYGILSNIYSNPIGSIVREYTSNAVDAAKEAGSEEPVLVKLTKKNGTYYFIVEDFGTGISPEAAQNIYFNYLDSTKEDSDDLIGAYGIGSKSALAYTNSFDIITRYEGIEYYYIFNLGKNAIPEGQLGYEMETDKPNGTKIQIPVKEDDLRKFHKEMEHQIIYFLNLYRECDIDKYYLHDFNNDYKLIENSLYKYNTLEPFSEMHILLGNVAYPIDFDNLGFDTDIRIPIGIKFDIGELQPTPSREDIQYTQEAKELITDRINMVLEHIQSKYDESIENIETLKEYIDNGGGRVNSYDFLKINVGESKYKIRLDSNYIKFKSNVLAPFERIGYDSKDVETFLLNYRKLDKVINPDTGYLKGINNLNFTIRNLSNNYEGYFLKKKGFNHTKNLFIADHYSDKKYIIERDPTDLRAYKLYLNLHNYPKDKWRAIIETYQKLTDDFIEENILCYDDIEISKDWLDERKKAQKEKKMQAAEWRKSNASLVVYKRTSGDNKPYIWLKDDYTISEMRKAPGIVVYSEKADSEYLENIFSVFRYKIKKFSVIHLAKTNHKYVSDLSNYYKPEEFMKSQEKLLSKIATALHIIKLDKENPNGEVFDNTTWREERLNILNTERNEKINKVFKYAQFYSKMAIGYRWSSNRLSDSADDNKFIQAFYDDMKNRNLLDQDMINKYYEIAGFIDEYKAINYYFSEFAYSGDTNRINSKVSHSYYQILADYCKYNKIPVNKDWYLKPEANKFINYKLEENYEENH